MVEGAAEVAAQGGELEGVNGWASAVPGGSGQGEVEPLRPRRLAPKRLRDRTTRQGDRDRQQQRRKGSGKGEAGRRLQQWWQAEQCHVKVCNRPLIQSRE